VIDHDAIVDHAKGETPITRRNGRFMATGSRSYVDAFMATETLDADLKLVNPWHQLWPWQHRGSA
jgi:hypothetical protein